MHPISGCTAPSKRQSAPNKKDILQPILQPFQAKPSCWTWFSIARSYSVTKTEFYSQFTRGFASYHIGAAGGHINKTPKPVKKGQKASDWENNQKSKPRAELCKQISSNRIPVRLNSLTPVTYPPPVKQVEKHQTKNKYNKPAPRPHSVAFVLPQTAGKKDIAHVWV